MSNLANIQSDTFGFGFIFHEYIHTYRKKRRFSYCHKKNHIHLSFIFSTFAEASIVFIRSHIQAIFFILVEESNVSPVVYTKTFSVCFYYHFFFIWFFFILNMGFNMKVSARLCNCLQRSLDSVFIFSFSFSFQVAYRKNRSRFRNILLWKYILYIFCIFFFNFALLLLLLAFISLSKNRRFLCSDAFYIRRYMYSIQ